ncbi:MAG: hypothetical protein ABI767_12610 [Rhodanobacter sp.]
MSETDAACLEPDGNHGSDALLDLRRGWHVPALLNDCLFCFS